MIPTNLENDATSDACTENDESNSVNKPEKLRSIKLSRLSNYQPDAASSEESTPSEVSSCSDTRKGSSLASPCWSESSSGSMEVKKKLEMRTRQADDASPNYFKPTSSSDARKLPFKASPRNSESGYCNDKNRIVLNQSSTNLGLPSTRSMKSLTRKSSMKPLRILRKTVSLKPEGSIVPQSPDLSVHKGTCSSVLKGSKLPDDVEIQPVGNGGLVKKVCPYSYCSLHGHKHENSPPLKRFLSTRRQQVKSQKGTKQENHSPQKAKQSGIKKKRGHNREMANNCNPEVQETDYAGAKAKSKEEGSVVSNLDSDLNGESEIRILEDVSNSLQEPSAAIEERKRDSAEDNGGFPQLDPRSSTDRESNAQLEKQNYSSLWSLIYQHMASDTASTDDANTLLGENSNESSQGLSTADKDKHAEVHDAGNKEIELNQTVAIKLVQEAINAILFPETQEHSFDEQSITGDTISDQERSGKHRGEDEELGISTTRDLGKENYGEVGTEGDGKMQQDQEMLLGHKNSVGPGEEKSASKEINKSKQMASMRWSNLKKVILLKRFVKALERMRNFNPRKPQYLPLEPDPEAEKVYLRRQMMEEKKNAEEWMLDYALRQVISKLAPVQKRRVALLVNAYETVVPPAEITTPRIRPNLGGSSPVDPAKACTGSSKQSTGATKTENNDGNLNDKLQDQTSSDVSIKIHQDQVSDSDQTEHHNQHIFPDVKEKTSECCMEAEPEARDADQIIRVNLDNGGDNYIRTDDQYDIVSSSFTEPENSGSLNKHTLKPDDTSTYHENVPELQISRAIISNLTISCNGDADSNSKAMESTGINSPNGKWFDESGSSTPENNKGSSAINNVVSSPSVLQTMEPTTASNKMNAEANPANKVFPEFSPEESDPHCSTATPPETSSEKQNYSRLWSLVYKHMASGVTVTDGTQPPDVAGKIDKEEDVESVPSGSWQDLSETDCDMRRENDDADKQKNKLQDEAVKLVQEAIDQILLPEVEDHFSDDQSVSSDTTPKQELLEKNRGWKELFISTSIVPVEDTCKDPDRMEVEYSTVPNPGEGLLISKNHAEQGGKTATKEGSKSNIPAPKRWSNLKKIILLKRFVKAMEKVRKLNPQEPRYLPLEPNTETEKVNLKHQENEGRKNAEEWMLDYAIQQVVTKLTPARKKKVQLLVEAFETVTPSMETETRQRRNTAASPHGHSFKSLLGH